MTTDSPVRIGYRRNPEATRLLVDYLNTCPHGFGVKAKARLPDGQLVCWPCYLRAFMAVWRNRLDTRLMAELAGPYPVREEEKTR